MMTPASTRPSFWKFLLLNSFLLVHMVIKTDFSSGILFFRKQEIDFSQTNNLDNYLSDGVEISGISTSESADV